MNRQQYKRKWLRYLKSYERKSYTLFRAALIRMAKNIPFDNMTETNYTALIELNVSNQAMFEAYYNVYNQIGQMHGDRVGKGINKDIKDYDPINFLGEFQRGLREWILENVGYRIISVRQTYIEFIRKLIADGLAEGRTIRQLAKEIQQLINRRDFYRWQSLRIARTETAAAANRGAIIAGETSNIIMEKEWLSSNDSRTRRTPPDKFDHLEMDGVRVEQGQPFNVQGQLLDYPGAPVQANDLPSDGAAVIQCRCTVALVPKRDSNGRIMRRVS